jgi:hypothetical protein
MELLRAGAQGRLQLVLQCLEVAELSPDLKEFFLEAKTHRGTGLQTAAAQREKLANFLERKPQALGLANESQSFQVRIVVLPKATGGSRRTRKQGVSLVKANCVRGETDLSCYATDMHKRLLRGIYTLEYSLESSCRFYRLSGQSVAGESRRREILIAAAEYGK